MRYGITGPARLPADGERLVQRVVYALEPAPHDEFTSGCADGVDTVGAWSAWGTGFRRMRLTLPTGARCNEELEKFGKEAGWDLEYAPKGKTAAMTYMYRNDLTVAYTDILLAFPLSHAEENRSGTWATVRRARSARKEIRFFPLDGEAGWVENPQCDWLPLF